MRDRHRNGDLWNTRRVLITNHVLAGALIGSRSSSVTQAALSGVASHFAMDAVPHYRLPHDQSTRIAVLDGLLGLATIGATLAAAPRRDRARVAAGIAGACFPDLDKPGRLFFGRSPFPAVVDRWHVRIQTELPQLINVEVGASAVLTALLSRAFRLRSAGR